MKKLVTKNYYYLLLTLPLIILFNTCQKDLGVEPVYSDGGITGIIHDSSTNQPLDGVNVLVFREDDKSEYSTVTDNKGSFSVTIPVLPIKKPFRVVVTKSGYESFSGIFDCDCDTLFIGLVKLKKLSCGIIIEPDTRDFQNVTIGTWQKLPLRLKNVSLSSVIVQNINIGNSDVFVYDSQNPKVPFSIPGGSYKDIHISFNPKVVGKVTSSISVINNCDSSNISVGFLTGVGVDADCYISYLYNHADSTVRMYRFGQDSIYKFFIFNTADTVLNYNVQIVPMYVTDPAILNKILSISPSGNVPVQPKSFREITVRVVDVEPGDIFGGISITPSNSNCSEFIKLWVYYYIGGLNTKVLYRWNQTVPGSPYLHNPNSVNQGFSFAKDSIMTDAHGICLGDDPPTPPNISFYTTDFRFNGIQSVGVELFARMSFVFEYQKLGNSYDEDLLFAAKIWQPRINQAQWQQAGCGVLFREGDVIAVHYKTSLGNIKEALIRIETIRIQQPEKYEQLTFSYLILTTD